MKHGISSRRVVVTGLGAVTSIGHDVGSFWSGLVAGKIGIHRVTHFDTSLFALTTASGTCAEVVERRLASVWASSAWLSAAPAVRSRLSSTASNWPCLT